MWIFTLESFEVRTVLDARNIIAQVVSNAKLFASSAKLSNVLKSLEDTVRGLEVCLPPEFKPHSKQF